MGTLKKIFGFFIGVLMMKARVCMLDIDDLRKAIMEEAYCLAYAMHPDSTKMY